MDSRRHDVCVGIGSNIERERNVADCLAALIAAFGEIRVSSVYESEAEGYSGPPYYNLAAGFLTALSPGEVAGVLHRIEQAQGRVRLRERYADRTLDVDILLFDDLCGEFDGLRLPRDEILRVAHVLVPLAEIVPQRILPGTGQTMAKWCEQVAPGGASLRRVPFSWRGRPLPAVLGA